jgi:esterase/lipase superfamily enzyme
MLFLFNVNIIIMSDDCEEDVFVPKMRRFSTVEQKRRFSTVVEQKRRFSV